MLWDTVKSNLQEFLPSSEYSLWIKPLVCHRSDEKILELAGPDRFFCAWVKERYLDQIRSTLRALCTTPPELRICVNNGEVLQIDDGRKGQLRLPGVKSGSSYVRSLHPGYTFDQFMVGESNLLARSACQAIAKGDNTYGQCLFMNSSPGLGKSHLTQAVAHQVFMDAPGARLHYLTAQQFSAEMVKGIQTGTMERFSRKYVNNCDILLVEDVHTLTGKNKTQNELNTILDYLLKSGRRVIFTSAVSPRRLDGIDEDFRSRMTAGLVTQIKAPDYKTRYKIIMHKAQKNNLVLKDTLIEMLACHLHGDIRKIESVLLSIHAKSSLLNAPPDESMVMDILEEVLGRPADINGEMIQSFISSQYKISVNELKSKSRRRPVAFPRQIGMYLTRKYTDLSLSDIGHLYNRDHSTVLYAIKSITKDVSRKATVRKQLEMLCQNLKK